MTGRRAFTLIEIIIAVMLTGLLTALALAPVVITVRRVVDTRREYSDGAALSMAAAFIGRDIFAAMRLSTNVLSVKDHDALGGKAQDILIVATSAPAIQNMASGTVIYTVTEGGILHGNILPGLYRWVIPNADPSEVDHEKLDPSAAQLVLPGADEFRVEVPTNDRTDDNLKEYNGALPAGIFIDIGRGENHVRSVITFP